MKRKVMHYTNTQNRPLYQNIPIVQDFSTVKMQASAKPNFGVPLTIEYQKEEFVILKRAGHKTQKNYGFDRRVYHPVLYFVATIHLDPTEKQFCPCPGRLSILWEIEPGRTPIYAMKIMVKMINYMIKQHTSIDDRYRKYYDQLADSKIYRLTDQERINIYWMQINKASSFRIFSCFFLFFNSPLFPIIILTGDIFFNNKGLIVHGLDKRWFSSDLSPANLAEKFLVPEWAKDKDAGNHFELDPDAIGWLYAIQRKFSEYIRKEEEHESTD